MWIFWFKALHIFGFVSWMAGLFYLGRILVYWKESSELQEPEREILVNQFSTMAKRVYKIICNPGLMITFTFGFAMLFYQPAYFESRWIHIKLLLVFLMMAYHLYCKRMIKQFDAGPIKWSSFKLRLWNEVPSVILVAIIMLAVFRDQINYFYLLLGLAIFCILLYLSANAYRKRREAKKS